MASADAMSLLGQRLTQKRGVSRPSTLSLEECAAMSKLLEADMPDASTRLDLPDVRVLTLECSVAED